MGYPLSKFDGVRSVLEPGEEVLGGVPVCPLGRTQRMAVSAATATTFGVAIRSRAIGDTSPRLPVTGDAVLAVTDRRLLMFSSGKLTNKPKELVTSVPLGELIGVERRDGKAGAAKMVNLAFVFADGSVTLVETFGTFAGPCDQLLAHLPVLPAV